MNVRLLCPVCEAPGRTAVSGPTTWVCSACDHTATLNGPVGGQPLTACVACNAEIFRKKDFPHGLGMAILVAAFVSSTITYFFYDVRLTWVILLGSAAFDGILYLLVKDVLVCYRCGAEHRFPSKPVAIDPAIHHPFELSIHERYRQERLRQPVAPVAPVARSPEP